MLVGTPLWHNISRNRLRKRCRQTKHHSKSCEIHTNNVVDCVNWCYNNAHLLQTTHKTRIINVFGLRILNRDIWRRIDIL